MSTKLTVVYLVIRALPNHCLPLTNTMWHVNSISIKLGEKGNTKIRVSRWKLMVETKNTLDDINNEFQEDK